MTSQMLVPGEWRGTPDQFPVVKGYEWIAKLPDKKIYLSNSMSVILKTQYYICNTEVLQK